MIRYYGWRTGSRHVLVIGPLTFKFPRLWIRRFFETLMGNSFGMGWFPYRLSLRVSFCENLTEAKWFFKRNRPPQPVYCILPLVLVNVYPTAQGVGKPKVCEYLYYIWKQTGRKEWLPGLSPEFKEMLSRGGCSHHFEQNNNFALKEGVIRFVDYGTDGVMDLAVNHQAELQRLLDAVKEYSGVS